MSTTVRAMGEADHDTIIAVVNEWWGGRNMSWLLPRLFFQHFGDTSFVVEDDGELLAFLIGFVSQANDGEAYVHLVGVHPDHRGSGMGKSLYETFFEEVKKRGCERVSCITSPVNAESIAFHRAMGFGLKRGTKRRAAFRSTRTTTGPAKTGWCSRKRSSEAYSIRTGKLHKTRGPLAHATLTSWLEHDCHFRLAVRSNRGSEA